MFKNYMDFQKEMSKLEEKDVPIDYKWNEKAKKFDYVYEKRVVPAYYGGKDVIFSFHRFDVIQGILYALENAPKIDYTAKEIADMINNKNISSHMIAGLMKVLIQMKKVNYGRPRRYDEYTYLTYIFAD